MSYAHFFAVKAINIFVTSVCKQILKYVTLSVTGKTIQTILYIFFFISNIPVLNLNKQCQESLL
jgi:hypothetical protein